MSFIICGRDDSYIANLIDGVFFTDSLIAQVIQNYCKIDLFKNNLNNTGRVSGCIWGFLVRAVYK